jgi:polyhydroxyalkanoate synthesis regulator phasin
MNDKTSDERITELEQRIAALEEPPDYEPGTLGALYHVENNQIKHNIETIDQHLEALTNSFTLLRQDHARLLERVAALEARLSPLEKAVDPAPQSAEADFVFLSWEKKYENGTYRCGVEFNDGIHDCILTKAWHSTDVIELYVKTPTGDVLLPLNSRQLKVLMLNCKAVLARMEDGKK